jgi:hypothetical protein
MGSSKRCGKCGVVGGVGVQFVTGRELNLFWTVVGWVAV